MLSEILLEAEIHCCHVWAAERVKKDVNAKLTTNFINILKYKTNHLKQNQQTRLQNQQSPMQNQQSFTELSLDGVQKIDIT
jgi:hypothetical protein